MELSTPPEHPKQTRPHRWDYVSIGIQVHTREMGINEIRNLLLLCDQLREEVTSGGKKLLDDLWLNMNYIQISSTHDEKG